MIAPYIEPIARQDLRSIYLPSVDGSRRLRVFAFGCGRQSAAALVLAKRGILDVDTFLFANVGEDSENPATIRYFRDVAQPYARQNGINLVEVRRMKKDGYPETILSRILVSDSSIPLPVRMNDVGTPGRRTCTADFKIRVMAKWLRENGATPDKPAVMCLGISLDEYKRMRNDSGFAYEQLDYPLINLKLSVSDCLEIVASEGLPPAPRSACWFCPMHRVGEWREMRKSDPGLFFMAAGLERLINERRKKMGKDPVWLSYYRRPLASAISENGPTLEEETLCDSGVCFV